jgi:hypothetical protein
MVRTSNGSAGSSRGACARSRLSRAWRTSAVSASPVSPSTRRESSQPRRRRTTSRCDAAAEEGDQVHPPDRAAGLAFGSRPHGVPAPAPTGARARQRLRDRAARLHARELEGESAATPAIILAEVVLFLIPIFLTMVALTFAAYYLSR